MFQHLKWIKSSIQTEVLNFSDSNEQKHFKQALTGDGRFMQVLSCKLPCYPKALSYPFLYILPGKWEISPVIYCLLFCSLSEMSYLHQKSSSHSLSVLFLCNLDTSPPHPISLPKEWLLTATLPLVLTLGLQ